MVGHGSSDNAASYGVYAFGLLPRWTALRDSIALTVYYGAQLDMAGSTVLAPLAVGPDARRRSSTSRARAARGAFTVAVTNDAGLRAGARRRGACSRSRAGTERAVAATKTYSNQVAALALLAAPCRPGAATSSPTGSARPPTCSKRRSPSSRRRRARSRCRSPSSAGCS